tara:strand:- start:1696 stop:2100 length:405 start_codon:yes stop_codon:yes gene_type:complete
MGHCPNSAPISEKAAEPCEEAATEPCEEPVADTADPAPDPAPDDAPDDAVPAPKRKRTRTSKKEPKAPKAKPRPQNAYMLFYCQELQNPSYKGVPLPERAKAIGAMWREMDDEKRAPFVEQAATAKAKTEEAEA